MTKYKSPCCMICKYNDEGICQGCDRTREEIINWPEYDENKRKEVYDQIIERGGNPYKKKRYDF